MINYNASPPTNVVNYALSFVSPGEDWILYTSSENHYVMIFSTLSHEWNKIDIYRDYTQGSGYSYRVSDVVQVDEPTSPSYPLYAYSSIPGYGTYVSNPRASDSTAFSTAFLAVSLCLVVIFGGIFRRR